VTPPEAGKVIHYAYLWADEHEQGREEGSKDRPCTIIAAVHREADGRTMVIVVPITRSPQGADCVELSPEIKARIGLDPEQSSWVVCTEYNRFEWPGPDLRSIPKKGEWEYGRLPDELLLQIQDMLRAAAREHRLRVVARTS
jgi:hypothetical protein